MQGLEIAEKYFYEYGEKMLKEFPEVFPRVAAGLVGFGSECFGFDDEISKDHDFEPCFCIWLTDEDERKYGFKLSRAYSKLPKEFMGLKRQVLSPVGGDRHGVSATGEFYSRFLGSEGAPESLRQWLYLPSESLAAAVNGKVFLDNLGEFSALRKTLAAGYPQDVKRKKIAARLVFAAQSGQYNFGRCVKRGERGAAALSVHEFVKNAVSLVYLLNNSYEPFYKWAFRGMKRLPLLNRLEPELLTLLETQNEGNEAQEKQKIIDGIAALLAEELNRQGLSTLKESDLERQAFAVADGIKDGELRNMHIMEG